MPDPRAESDATNSRAEREWTWDWFNDSDSYGVRHGDEIICLTNRTKAGYERALAIVQEHNAALHATSENVGAGAADHSTQRDIGPLGAATSP